MEITIGKGRHSFPAYFKEAAREGGKPAVILIHEIWGLNPNIRSIADRIAAEGFDVLAPDLMSGTGFTGGLDAQLVRDMHDPKRKDEAQKRLRAIFAPVHSPKFAKGAMSKLEKCRALLGKGRKVAAVGFCFGGTYSFASACDLPLKAAVVFYGRPPEPLSKVKGVRCPVLAFYGEKDHNLIDGLPALEKEMRKRGKDFTYKKYRGCGHAFFNDTNKRMYNRAAASDSWKVMLAFLREKMGS